MESVCSGVHFINVYDFDEIELLFTGGSFPNVLKNLYYIQKTNGWLLLLIKSCTWQENNQQNLINHLKRNRRKKIIEKPFSNFNTYHL